MALVLTLLINKIYLDPPYQLVAWLGLFILLGVTILLTLRWSGPLNLKETKNKWVLISLVLITVPVSLFLGISLPKAFSIVLPGLPVVPQPPLLMLFSALPWVLTGGFFGVLPAVVLGFISGLLRALFETHSPFTPLEIAGLALLFSYLVRQRYRSAFFSWMRHPILAALFLSLAYAPVYLLTGFLGSQGDLAPRLDFTLTQTLPLSLSHGGELLLAAAFAELLYVFKVSLWGRKDSLVPSPVETSLPTRFLTGAIPLIVILMLTLLVSDWVIAGRAAEAMMRKQLSSTALTTAESLPYFLETGQNLIRNLAQVELTRIAPDQVQGELARGLRLVPFFHQLYLFDGDGLAWDGYPVSDETALQLSPDERTGINLALKGVPIQLYTLSPLENGNTAQVSFIATILNESGNVVGVLLGRTDFRTNPFTQPLLKGLESVQEMGGSGLILDEQQRILFDTLGSASSILTEYHGKLPEDSNFFYDTSPTGSRRLGYFYLTSTQLWSIVLFMPVEQNQQLALQIAGPLLLILVIVVGISLVFVLIALRGISFSLKQFSQEATHISRGQFGHPLSVSGEDEVGQLGNAFEQMRLSLKARLEELNRLLVVSQGVASSLSIKKALKPILEAALSDGACMARVVLFKDVLLDQDAHADFVILGAGPAGDAYAYLDTQLFELMVSQEIFTVFNTSRLRRFNLPVNGPRPGALAALALRQEQTYFGVLWLAFDRPHNFTEDEVRFLTTLASQASLATSNSRLYAIAEVGRQRVEAILDSAAEPILVFDDKLNLLLINPAAMQIAGLLTASQPGSPAAAILAHQGLHEFLSQTISDRVASREIEMPGGKFFFASVANIMIDDRYVGKVCILRDITHYRRLDTLKTEFVTTVSHGLRSPLTLLRGYATMLQMVGDLNEQQKKYSQKIVQSVENMARMVNNLLDLGRIEAGVDLQVESVQMVDLINQVINALEPNSVQKNIQLESRMEAGAPIEIHGERALLQQAIYNLVENSIKYTPSGGHVIITLHGTLKTVIIEVADNGIGIAPLDSPHLFEKFYRSGRREAYQQRGTGLGLAIVKSIAERHQGRVWVESQLGKGSKFYLEVPQSHPEKPTEDY
jgi:signal transduction histidine kinase/HAMP domain-containing protein